MKNLVFVLFLALAITSCGSKKLRPEGAPPAIKEKQLHARIDSAQNTYQTLIVKANGRFTDNKGSQSFKVEFRLLKDSLVWVDIADPILGIKVARAIVFSDSVAFVNKLERQFYQGNIEKLAQKIKMDLGFELLQNILSANLAYPIKDKAYELFYRPGSYVFADFRLDEVNDSLQNFPKGLIHQVFIDPKNAKPNRQLQTKYNENQRYELLFQNFAPQKDLLYPKNISVISTGKTEAKLDLQIKSVKKNVETKYPIKIPAGYESIF
jgi:hypothetical protein